MANEHVYRYLNEHQQINVQLKQVYAVRSACLKITASSRKAQANT